MTPIQIENLKVGDTVTLTNPEGTFKVVNRGSFPVEGQQEDNRFIELFHTPESLREHPLPPAIVEQGDRIKCHARLTFLQSTGQWVYGSLPHKAGQEFPDHRPAE